MSLFLPSNWVYVEYENGRTENVANTDTLTENEAGDFKEMWDTKLHKVVRVTLETSKRKVLKSFTY